MFDQFLVKFSRNYGENSADFGEKVGNVGLALLRIGCGKTVNVTKISQTSDPCFTTNLHSISKKVAAIALFVLALPVTALLAGIGFIGVACSKSHRQIFHSYSQIQEQKRKIPPPSMHDTVCFTSGGMKSIHGEGELFSDKDILGKLKIEREDVIEHVPISYTKNKKAIIQQQATRGCTAATAAMLIVDNGKTPNWSDLPKRNLGNEDYQVRDIEQAGLIAIRGFAKNLSELRDLIISKGSSIVSILGKLGAHVVVVDEISQDLSKVRLRDPYHGWEITVTKEAFLEEWKNGSYTIQAENPAH